MSDFTGFVIDEIKDDVIWIKYIQEGQPVYKEPLARCLRKYLDELHGEDNQVNQGARAFEKMAIDRAFDEELLRA